jgi:DNA-binding NarL/FixJ family response regulator
MSTQLRILLVESDPLVRQALTAALGGACGAEVWNTASTEQGLDLALTHKPDLVLMDLGVPGIDGLALCQAIAEHSELMMTKLWIMTGVTLDEQTRAALACYADRLIQMPISAAVLCAEVRALIEPSGPPLQWLGE